MHEFDKCYSNLQMKYFSNKINSQSIGQLFKNMTVVAVCTMLAPWE